MSIERKHKIRNKAKAYRNQGSRTHMTSGQARILIGCQEVPGYGGASTASYKLFEMMKNDGLDVHYLNLITQEEGNYFRYAFGEHVGNPKCLADVHTYVVRELWDNAQHELTALIHLLSPDRLVGIGWKAAALMKRAAPEQHLTFVTTGISQMRRFIEQGQMEDFISLRRSLQCSTRESRLYLDATGLDHEAAIISDSIITHSDMIRFLYQNLFQPPIGKVHDEVMWFAEWIAQETLEHAALRQPFGERDIDVLFVASSWMRPEKNYRMLKDIVSRSKDLRIHIAGEVDETTPHANHYGLIATRSELFSLMGRAKAVVSPSLFDAAPGILFEASVMGCNIIASKNCGNWEICNSSLLVDPFHVDGFVEKIFASLSRKYEDNMDYFLAANSYKKLMDRILTS